MILRLLIIIWGGYDLQAPYIYNCQKSPIKETIFKHAWQLSENKFIVTTSTLILTYVVATISRLLKMIGLISRI